MILSLPWITYCVCYRTELQKQVAAIIRIETKKIHNHILLRACARRTVGVCVCVCVCVRVRVRVLHSLIATKDAAAISNDHQYSHNR
jgi:hypothetical protein